MDKQPMSDDSDVGTSGYLAVPPSGEGPGVLVLHAWWGLNAEIKAVCDRLAALGFVAYAPDLFEGQVAATIEAAEQLSGPFDGERTVRAVGNAARTLRERAETRKQGLGVVAFSYGAYYALRLSVDDPERVRAVVLFYGTHGQMFDDFGSAHAVYQGHFAELDPYETAENVDGLERALQSSGRSVTFHRYAGVGHWFFEPDRVDAYDAAAATLAWERTAAFLKANLS